jgi:hypothetical protein
MSPRGDGKSCAVCLTGDIRMGWSGRAPALPAREAGKGRSRQGARHVSETQLMTRAFADVTQDSRITAVVASRTVAFDPELTLARANARNFRSTRGVVCACAILVLITNSSSVGCFRGRSAGLATRNSLSTYSAALPKRLLLVLGHGGRSAQCPCGLQR